MDRVKILNEKGSKILYMDFTYLRDYEDIKSIIDSSREYIRVQDENSALTLTNLEGMHFNSEIKNAFSSFIGGNKPYVRASAVIGLSGLLRMMYNGVNRLTGRDIRSFNSKDEAIDWLANRSN